MAKRRKVGNLLALAVLSTVTARPMHPYEMASLMRARGKDRDIDIKWGTLYTVVRNLEKHGFLAVEGSVREGARPERTVYRITDAGREELADWVRELVAVPERESPRFVAALSVLGALGPDEASELMRRRLGTLEREIAEQDAALADAADVPRVFLIESEYELAMRRAEAAWVRALLADIAAGTLQGLDLWRAFHETGEIPPEMAELAERGAEE
ncbi:MULTISPECIES: PadR family transcriptional regulator [Actinomadura]|uniref:PadR family transcriptional regulator n=1 Tax=Actinomadura litoris TaxID=2678616 RepID=A0A7K1LCN0_9ACTN|nr:MULTISPECIES: PadR family transcriptional regulator [Actinomadura]MBT2214081.1 PadR family transcriptional regulator [Actinomadura sp. NEAU-AAG7]MUN42174.1 PadR family transcriptional regulator [Actinomadura litoris]